MDGWRLRTEEIMTEKMSDLTVAEFKSVASKANGIPCRGAHIYELCTPGNQWGVTEEMTERLAEPMRTRCLRQWRGEFVFSEEEIAAMPPALAKCERWVRSRWEESRRRSGLRRRESPPVGDLLRRL